MSEAEPIQLSPRSGAGLYGPHAFAHATIPLDRLLHPPEFCEILDLYGRKVAAGEWRDYAIDFGREKAVFSVFRRASEVPLYRIEKNPRLARRQGAYSVIAATGLILKRGHELGRAGRPGEGRPAGRGLASIAPVSLVLALLACLYGCLWLSAPAGAA